MKILLFPILLLFIGCNSVQTTKPVGEEGPVSILTGKSGGTSISDLVGLGSGDGDGNSMPVNAILWRAALDIAFFIPLADVDTFGGSIITEWYALPDRSDERIKLAIFIIGRELRSDAVRVKVHVQRRNGDEWGEASRDEDFARKMEDLILTRAREIRAETLSEIVK